LREVSANFDKVSSYPSQMGRKTAAGPSSAQRLSRSPARQLHVPRSDAARPLPRLTNAFGRSELQRTWRRRAEDEI